MHHQIMSDAAEAISLSGLEPVPMLVMLLHWGQRLREILEEEPHPASFGNLLLIELEQRATPAFRNLAIQILQSS